MIRTSLFSFTIRWRCFQKLRKNGSIRPSSTKFISLSVCSLEIIRLSQRCQVKKILIFNATTSLVLHPSNRINFETGRGGASFKKRASSNFWKELSIVLFSMRVESSMRILLRLKCFLHIFHQPHGGWCRPTYSNSIIRFEPIKVNFIHATNEKSTGVLIFTHIV